MHPKYILYLKQFRIHFFMISRPISFISLSLFSFTINHDRDWKEYNWNSTAKCFLYNLDHLLVSYTINPIEVKGRIAILIAYRGDSVFISRLVIMRTGRFCVDAAVYRFMHPSLQAPAVHFFPGFKMILIAFFIDYFRKEREAEAVKRDASFIFCYFIFEIVPSSIKSNPVDQDSSKKRENEKEK